MCHTPHFEIRRARLDEFSDWQAVVHRHPLLHLVVACFKAVVCSGHAIDPVPMTIVGVPDVELDKAAQFFTHPIGSGKTVGPMIVEHSGGFHEFHGITGLNINFLNFKK